MNFGMQSCLWTHLKQTPYVTPVIWKALAFSRQGSSPGRRDHLQVYTLDREQACCQPYQYWGLSGTKNQQPKIWAQARILTKKLSEWENIIPKELGGGWWGVTRCEHTVWSYSGNNQRGLPAKPLNPSAVTFVLTPGKRDKNWLSVNI